MRAKVVFLLLSLAALWVFAASVTLREGLNLLYVGTLTERLGKPTEALLDAVQKERKASLAYIGGPVVTTVPALQDAQRRTDAARAQFERLARQGLLQLVASPALERRISEEFDLLTKLDDVRDRIDRNAIGRTEAATAFTAIIDGGFRIYGSIAVLDDEEIAKESRTLVELSRARELLAQEDSLVAGALAAGRFTPDEVNELVKLIGSQEFLYGEAVAELRSRTGRGSRRSRRARRCGTS